MVLLQVPLAALLLFQSAGSPAQGPPPAPKAGQTAPNTGSEPPLSLGARDVFADYHLPPLEDRPADGLWHDAEHLQAIARASRLHLGDHSAVDAWKTAETTYRAAHLVAEGPRPGSPTVFNGTRVSELNALLSRPGAKNIRVASPSLTLDACLHIAGSGSGEHVSLDLGTARFERGAGSACGPYMIRIEHAHDVKIWGGVLFGSGWGVLVAGSRGVALMTMAFEGLSGGGIVVTASEDVIVWGNRLERLGKAGVLLHGSTHRATVAENEITGNLGSSNWNAGVVLTDRDADLAADPANLLQADQYWAKEEPVLQRLVVPEDNLIAFNDIAGNLSSGVYSDGSTRTVVVGNRIERNSKEGMCLDNGSAADLVAYNLFEANGDRWGMTDLDLQRDFVFNFGRLPDHTSPAKVPAISIDNAAYNEILFNEINRNYGGGVKMVRTGFYNIVGLNTITDDNEGRSPRFHFFGVELGSARSDAPSAELDFTPSRGNEIFGNIIRGMHYAGMFFADGSDQNTIFDNSIFGATDWAMESVRRQANITINNLTNLKLRNISSGLDPNLFGTGAGVYDGH